MRLVLALVSVATTMLLEPLWCQDLAPRAYLITPVHSNAVTLAYSLYYGNISFDGVLPITDSKGTVHTGILAYYHSLRLFGRSANFTGYMPYGIGHFSGKITDNQGQVTEINPYRSGLFYSTFRFSVNLVGGPAMDLPEFVKWRQKTLVGFSFKVTTPTGQYDPAKLINFGANRWAFKPELGLSRRWGHWIVDAYGGGWFFTTNNDFFSLGGKRNTQSQSPIAAFEGHLSYDVKPRLWASFDGNFWRGGTSTLNGVENPKTVQNNSRVGGTLSVPVSKHQSLKFSYANGAYIRYGGNFQNVSVAWQYSWLGWPK